MLFTIFKRKIYTTSQPIEAQIKSVTYVTEIFLLKIAMAKQPLSSDSFTSKYNKISFKIQQYLKISFAEFQGVFPFADNLSNVEAVYYIKTPGLRGASRTAATFKMERFVIIVNGLKPLTIIMKRSILNVAAALDPPLGLTLQTRTQ